MNSIFECLICKISFPYYYLLQNHRREGHKLERDEIGDVVCSYSCSSCDRFFTSKQYYKSHTRAHFNEHCKALRESNRKSLIKTRRQCSVCYGTFSTSYNLSRHKRRCKGARKLVLGAENVMSIKDGVQVDDINQVHDEKQVNSKKQINDVKREKAVKQLEKLYRMPNKRRCSKSTHKYVAKVKNFNGIKNGPNSTSDSNCNIQNNGINQVNDLNKVNSTDKVNDVNQLNEVVQPWFMCNIWKIDPIEHVRMLMAGGRCRCSDHNCDWHSWLLNNQIDQPCRATIPNCTVENQKQSVSSFVDAAKALFAESNKPAVSTEEQKSNVQEQLLSSFLSKKEMISGLHNAKEPYVINIKTEEDV